MAKQATYTDLLRGALHGKPRTVSVSVDPHERAARRSSLSRAIEDISALLKGPLSNTERLMLLADRRDASHEIAMIDAGLTIASASEPSPRPAQP